jgi:flavocytochrome c
MPEFARTLSIAAAAALAIASCNPPPPPTPDADVIVIGAGIAGLSAALEANDRGAKVLLLEQNSVGGGHAVMAGGLFLVGTPLQDARGVQDSPDLAYRDIMAWGEDSNANWVRRYVDESRSEVHDWLAGFGVKFTLLLPAPGETSVPRFHFARGGAANVVVPLMQALTKREGIEWRVNHEVTSMERVADGIAVVARELRDGAETQLFAPAVIIATGGFESDMQRVRANWLPGVAQPERLLAGASRFARGAGLELGRAMGGNIARLDHQTIFVTGFPDPRDPDGERGLLAMNEAAVFINREGKRFVNEAASRKVLESTVLSSADQTYWMVFDAAGRKRLQVRGAPWLTRDTLAAEIIDNAEIVAQADSIAALAEEIGLPGEQLIATVERFNQLAADGLDEDFGRFGADSPRRIPKPLVESPFFALQSYPMTRKSMGGLQIDDQARMLDANGEVLPGLYSAGEVTGVAGINGSYGGSGTFLGPSILTGRIAGRTVAEDLALPTVAGGKRPITDSRAGSSPAISNSQAGTGATAPAKSSAPNDDWRYLDEEGLAWLLEVSRPGYWHFEVAHELVLEQQRDCAECHGPAWPTRMAQSRNEKRVQLESCTRCH